MPKVFPTIEKIETFIVSQAGDGGDYHRQKVGQFITPAYFVLRRFFVQQGHWIIDVRSSAKILLIADPQPITKPESYQ